MDTIKGEVNFDDEKLKGCGDIKTTFVNQHGFLAFDDSQSTLTLTSFLDSTEFTFTDSYFETTFMYETFRTGLTAAYTKCQLTSLGFE